MGSAPFSKARYTLTTTPSCWCILAALVCIVNRPCAAAEYNGCNIDGQTFDATVFSYSSGNYCSVEVEFDGDHATIYFPKGGYLTVTLDDEEIDDPHDISAYDYEHAGYWDLDLDGLDESGSSDDTT